MTITDDRCAAPHPMLSGMRCDRLSGHSGNHTHHETAHGGALTVDWAEPTEPWMPCGSAHPEVPDILCGRTRGHGLHHDGFLPSSAWDCLFTDSAVRVLWGA